MLSALDTLGLRPALALRRRRRRRARTGRRLRHAAVPGARRRRAHGSRSPGPRVEPAPLDSLGTVNHFHTLNPAADDSRDDQDNPNISWPNHHSGANGDYQPIFVVGPVHDLLRTALTPSGHIEWFPAHPHEGSVSAPPDQPFARAVAQGRSTVTGRRFNLAVAIEGESDAGRPPPRARRRLLDVPPLRRHELVPACRRSLLRHRPAGHGDRARSRAAGRVHAVRPQHRSLVERNPRGDADVTGGSEDDQDRVAGDAEPTCCRGVVASWSGLGRRQRSAFAPSTRWRRGHGCGSSWSSTPAATSAWSGWSCMT